MEPLFMRCVRLSVRPSTYSCRAGSSGLRTRPISSSREPLTRVYPTRNLHSSAAHNARFQPPKSRDRGPKSSEETQTDFEALNVLRGTAAPATAIDACTPDGFALNNQVRISRCGVLLVNGEVFRWWPWTQTGDQSDKAGRNPEEETVLRGQLINSKRQWEVPQNAWGVLDLVWPKPDLLIIGTGPNVVPISPSTRKYINDLGIRIEVQDTRNAAAQFNLLATERGVSQVAAALIPIGWKETPHFKKS